VRILYHSTRKLHGSLTRSVKACRRLPKGRLEGPVTDGRDTVWKAGRAGLLMRIPDLGTTTR